VIKYYAKPKHYSPNNLISSMFRWIVLALFIYCISQVCLQHQAVADDSSLQDYWIAVDHNPLNKSSAMCNIEQYDYDSQALPGIERDHRVLREHLAWLSANMRHWAISEMTHQPFQERPSQKT
jgi:hypothetical protein